MAKMTMEESIYWDADKIGEKCGELRKVLGKRLSKKAAAIIDDIQDHSCEIQTALERSDG